MLSKAVATGCLIAVGFGAWSGSAAARPFHNVPKTYWITPGAANVFLRAGLVVDTINGLTRTIGGSCTGTGAAKARVRNGLLGSGVGYAHLRCLVKTGDPNSYPIHATGTISATMHATKRGPQLVAD